MIRGVLTLAARPVGTIMPPRTEIQWIDLGKTQEDVRPDLPKLDTDIWPVRIPTAFSIFPHDIRGGSRRWAERRYERIVAFREVEEGPLRRLRGARILHGGTADGPSRDPAGRRREHERLTRACRGAPEACMAAMRALRWCGGGRGGTKGARVILLPNDPLPLSPLGPPPSGLFVART
ncbi:hypothetical protein [Aureimonas sp. AU4]|uniref:hypothetical protein n=1 Tax=Aureimonas sp. AU4 TaxID=1638163 RepID=UPI000785D8DE|nr:hypothetical protein [Aureimonas sp. AU4]